MEKKTWKKPELISLTRCKPEESVLAVCKYWTSSGDPTTSCDNCRQAGCGDCSATGIS